MTDFYVLRALLPRKQPGDVAKLSYKTSFVTNVSSYDSHLSGRKAKRLRNMPKVLELRSSQN